MSSEDLRLWKLEMERHQNWLKAAKSSPSTRHQVPSIKQQIEDLKKRKPKLGGGSSSNKKSYGNSGGFEFTLNPLKLLWMLIKFIFKIIWKIFRGILKG